MSAKRLMRAIGLIDDRFLDIADTTPARPYHSIAWGKYAALAACIVLVFGIVKTLPRMGASSADCSGSSSSSIPETSTTTSDTGSNEDTAINCEGEGGGTLIGAGEIYPTVMVNGRLYQWTHGAAIMDELPDTAEYYGEIVHTEGEMPESDCEFVSTFDAAGEIYTVEGDDSVVYLVVTTDWMDGAVVRLDRCG